MAPNTDTEAVMPTTPYSLILWRYGLKHEREFNTLEEALLFACERQESGDAWPQQILHGETVVYDDEALTRYYVDWGRQ